MMTSLFNLDAAGIAELCLRATALLMVPVVLGVVLRRTAASVRHTLWTTTFALLITLPVVVGAGFAVAVPMIPAPAPPEIVEAVPQSVETPDASVDAGGHVPSMRGEASISGFATPAEADGRQLGLGIVLWALWGLGCVGSLASVVIAFTRTRRLVAGARPLEDPDWSRRLADARERVGLQREVRLLMSSDVATPMAAGWIAPAVVLPENAEAWAGDRRDVVLSHELVHVRRHDAARQVLSHLALALYWFHPLSWIASRLSVVVREQACDEAVLRMGTRPSQYAGHLLEIARGVNTTPALLALPMIQRSHLEKRIMAILRPSQPKHSILMTAVGVGILAGVGVLAAIVQPIPLSSQVEPAQSLALEPTVVLPAHDAKAVQLAATPVLPVQTQELSCRVDGVRGSFSGTYSTQSRRTEMSGRYNGDRVIQKYDDDLRLCLRVRGDVVMDDDNRTVRAMGRDSWMIIESEDDALHRLVITEGTNGIEYAWSVDGRERAYDTAAQEWADRMFTILNGYSEASRIRGEQSSLRGQISSARGQVSSMRGQISSLRGQVSSMRGQISSHRGRASSKRGEISSLRGQVSSLQGSIASHRGAISSLSSAVRATDDSETQARLQREISEHQEAIQAVQREIEDFDLDSRVRDKQRELEGLEVTREVDRIEQEIEGFDLDRKVAEIQRNIEEYDLNGRVRTIEQQIEELDADRRAEEIERALRPELDALRRQLRTLR